MGCTSSAPPVFTSDANATERQKSIQFADDYSHEATLKITKENDDRHDNMNNVLPLCDTLAETIQLVKRDNISLEDLSPLEDRICQDIEKIESHLEKGPEILEIAKEEDKISTLEEVINMVIDLNHSEEESFKSEETSMPNEDQKDQSNIREMNDDNLELAENIQKNDEQNDGDEFAKEAMSPTQSESSRVTRWEALADIAAELPPSLTIDPITGQIYSLAK